jgi:hypothetical protein
LVIKLVEVGNISNALTQISLVRMLVITQLVHLIQISLVINLVEVATNAVTQISLVSKLVIKQQVLASNFIGQNAGYGATMLITHIGQNAGSNATGASQSTLIGFRTVLRKFLLWFK